MSAPGQTPRHGQARKPSLDGLLNMAIQLHQTGRINRAEQLYRQILSVSPKNADANHLLGLIKRQKGEPEAAIKLISRAIKSDPNNAIYHSNLGVTYKGMGRDHDAVRSYQRAIAIDPSMAALHNNLGVALQALGQHDKAINAFRKALALQPAYPEASNNLGISLLEKAEPAEQGPNVIPPESQEEADERLLAAKALSEEAEGHFRGALRIRPDYLRARMNLGQALQIQRRFEDAAELYKSVIASAPSADAFGKLGIVLAHQGDHESAIAAYHQALELAPDSVDVLTNLGMALSEIREYRQAVDHYRRALQINPEQLDILHYFGQALSQLGETDAAAEAFRAELRIDKDRAAAHRAILRLTSHPKADADTQAAMEAYDRSTPESEDRMHLAFGVGKAHEDQRDYKTAFDYFVEGNRIRRAGYDYETAEDVRKFETIKQIFTRELFESRTESGDPDETPIFILGMPRSGTTLTEQILSSHPDVHGADELGYVKELAIEFGLINNDTFNVERIAECSAGEFADLGRQYVEKARKQAGDARFVTDKMPHNFLNIGIIRLALPNARIIHCRRSPADNCLSIFKNYFISEAHRYAYDLVELGHYHNLYRDLMAHWHEVLPGAIHDIDYEATVADQETQSRALLEFCGLEWDDAVLSFHKTKRKVKTASIGQVHQPIYATSVKLSGRYGEVLDPLFEALSEYKDGGW